MPLLLLAARASLACATNTEDLPPDPDLPIVWPRGDATSDTIVVVRTDDHPVQLLGPYGVEVAVTRYDLPPELAVLVPDEPLEVGASYQVVTLSAPSDEFVVGHGKTGSYGAPVPVTRSAESGVRFEDAFCPEEAVAQTDLTYRLCEQLALPFAVVGGDQPPPDPTLTAPGDGLVYGTGDTVRLEEPLAPGWTGTVWLGGFDPLGRFVGWTADPVEMPTAGTIRTDRADGTSDGCPTGAGWSTEFEQTCDAWVLGTLDCVAPPEDTGTGDTGTGDTHVHHESPWSCGCATGAGGGAGWIALAPALLAAIRRGTPRPSGSGSAPPAGSSRRR